MLISRTSHGGIRSDATDREPLKHDHPTRARPCRLHRVHRADPAGAAGAAGILAEPDRQIPGVRHPRRRGVALLGLRRHPQSRPGAVLRRRRLHAGDVAETGQRHQPAAGVGSAGARLHALERRARRAHRALLHQQGLVPVAAVPVAMVRRRDGYPDAGGSRGRARHHRVPQAHRRRIRVGHHARAGPAGATGHHRRPARHQRVQRPDRPRHVPGRRLRVRPLFASNLLSGRRRADPGAGRLRGCWWKPAPD